MKHIVVVHDKSKWLAVPANNGGNGAIWQWEDELLFGYTCGVAQFKQAGHQVDYVNPHQSYLARSRDGGETWETWLPKGYVGNAGFLAENAGFVAENAANLTENAGFVAENAANLTENAVNLTENAGFVAENAANLTENAVNLTENAGNLTENAVNLTENAVNLTESLDFMTPGFVMRIEGKGYHGNNGCQWFYSTDKGTSWKGPHTFGSLFTHPELAGTEFTGRTGYLINSSNECFLFLSIRKVEGKNLAVSMTDKVFLAKTTDGGKTFGFVSWVVPPSDPYRAVMPAPVRISGSKLITAVRRRNNADVCWIDCYCSLNNGSNWEFLSRVGETGSSNGNPPAMIRLTDGRICCVFGNRDRCEILAVYSKDEGKTWETMQVLRDGFKSINGYADLGYPRLFQRPDGKLVAVYFWCSPEMPETHIEATIF